MKSYVRLFLSSFAISIIPLCSQANVFEAHAKCLAAIAEGDQQLTQQLAGDVLAATPISSSELKASGSSCLEAAFGGAWIYDESFGLFLPPLGVDLDAIAQAIPVDKRESLAKRLESASTAQRRKFQARLRPLVEAVDKENIKLIEQETYLACVSLYTKNAHEVITNSTCLNSFSRFGHPNLKETAAFKELLATLDSYEPDLGWASVLPLARSLLE